MDVTCDRDKCQEVQTYTINHQLRGSQTMNITLDEDIKEEEDEF